MVTPFRRSYERYPLLQIQCKTVGCGSDIILGKVQQSTAGGSDQVRIFRVPPGTAICPVCGKTHEDDRADLREFSVSAQMSPFPFALSTFSFLLSRSMIPGTVWSGTVFRHRRIQAMERTPLSAHSIGTVRLGAIV